MQLRLATVVVNCLTFDAVKPTTILYEDSVIGNADDPEMPLMGTGKALTHLRRWRQISTRSGQNLLFDGTQAPPAAYGGWRIHKVADLTGV